MTVHHIGYLVKDINKSREEFEKLGFVCEGDLQYDIFRDVDILFLVKDGYRIELVSPKSSNSVVANLIKKYRNSPYHICYESDDIYEDIENLESKGFTRIDDVCPAPALNNRNVSFLMNYSIGIIEILQK